MKIYAIKDGSISRQKTLAYLFYYENAKSFYIEIPSDADYWETPLLLSSFVKKGIYTVGRAYSLTWVSQRIIPRDRQNLGQILKDNHLTEYDEFSLLLLAEGRCAQDDCYIEEATIEDIPEDIKERWKMKIEEAIPTEDNLLLFFCNKESGVIHTEVLLESHPECRPYLSNKDRFPLLKVQPGGYGIYWSENAEISNTDLYHSCTRLPLQLSDFTDFVKYGLLSTSEACSILDCSRQNIDDLVKRDKLHPIRTDAKNKLFLKNEIIQRVK